MFAALRAGDLLTYAVLALGLSAVVSGLLGWTAGRPRSRRRSSASRGGLTAGTIGLVLAIATSTVAVVGVMHTRLQTDRDAEQLAEAERGRARQLGYEATRGIAKIGASLGGLALVLAAITVIRVTVDDKRRADDEGDEEWGLPIVPCVLGGVALFSVSAAAMPLMRGVPDAGNASGDPMAQIAAAEALLGEGRFSEGCKALSQAFEEGAQAEGPKRDTIRALVRECFEQRIEKASRLPALERKLELEAMQASKLPLSDAERARLATELAGAPP